MKTLQFVIELGSSNTVIYKMGNGIVLREPSLVVAKNNEDKIIEAGLKAKRMQGKTDENVMVFSPIQNGVIKNEQMCKQMLNYFLNKVMDYCLPKSFNILFCVQNGLNEEELLSFKNVAYYCNAKKVDFINVCKASTLFLGYNANNPHATISLNLGGGTVNMSVISMGEVIDGFSIGFGGNDMDKAIKDYVETVYNHNISLISAEKLKNDCGSLFVQDTTNVEVSGINVITKRPQTEIVMCNDVFNAVEHYFSNIAMSVERLLHLCSPDVVADITTNGIIVTGGLANMSGLEKYLSAKLNLKVFIPDQPENCAILGGAVSLS